jgi:hypothetical protein
MERARNAFRVSGPASDAVPTALQTPSNRPRAA